jgi:hypothetical protein
VDDNDEGKLVAIKITRFSPDMLEELKNKY